MKRVLTSFRSNSLHPAVQIRGFGILPNKFLATQGAVYVQGHCLQEQRIVYTSALLASTRPSARARDFP